LLAQLFSGWLVAWQQGGLVETQTQLLSSPEQSAALAGALSDPASAAAVRP